MSRLIVVSNRLPFTVQNKNEKWHFSASSGGLVTAVGAFLEREKAISQLDCIWVGWPGCEVEISQQAAVRDEALQRHGCWPIFLNKEEADQFYHGFCNKTLWPLFHYFPSYATFSADLWEAYVHANRRFCDELLGLVREGDQVWIHDYQLMLLPGMLRERRPDLSIGFFLHIPFPSFEIFRMLPGQWRRELLVGMLGVDVVGFHTYDYTQAFLRSVYRTLGFEHHLGQIQMLDRFVRADTFPIGIDFARFEMAAQSPAVVQGMSSLLGDLNGRRILFSVDRLDYTKGLLHRLRGFATFLASHPEWHGRVYFVLGVVPSREEVSEYRRMRKELNETVSLINGRYGTLGWVPIIYQYRNIPFDELVTLYRLADVALITPLRDGMNLVAKEFVACHVDHDGVLILSEMAGAARELGEAIQINPFHETEVAEAIAEALNMSPEEQKRRMQPMRERVRVHDASWWARSFLDTMKRVQGSQQQFKTQRLHRRHFTGLSQSLGSVKKRVFLLDYDGTLVPFAPLPHLAFPGEELRETLRHLASDEANAVYIISGRDRFTLDQWLGDLPLHLVAEHGGWIRPMGQSWHLLKPLASGWKDTLRPILQAYVARLSGSLLEEKDYSLAWHYRLADPELGRSRAMELVDDLVQYTANFDVQVLEGKKVVEIRNAGVHKGAAAMHVIQKEDPDAILAIGDDQTDEDLFRSLPEGSITIRVGQLFSNAVYSVRDYRDVRHLLGCIHGATSETVA
jgi:trehalose 6-phosphate synthase/phosphatase